MADEPAPRGIRYTYGRRQLWRALLQEVIVSCTSVRGRQGVRLSQLGELSDETLGGLRPAVVPGWQMTLRQGQVCGRAKGKEEAVPLFAATPENLAAFNLFDGQHTLREAGAQVAAQLGWEEARGFRHARGLLLELVARLVCLPANPPER